MKTTLIATTLALSFLFPSLAIAENYPGYTKVDETADFLWLIKNDTMKVYNRRAKEVSWSTVHAYKPAARQQNDNTAYVIFKYRANCTTGEALELGMSSYDANHKRTLYNDAEYGIVAGNGAVSVARIQPVLQLKAVPDDSYIAIARDIVCKRFSL